MTIQWGDTGKISYGTLKTFNVSLASPRETLLGSPVSLPTTEPATSQISLTIGSSDIPTITPSLPTSKLKYTALLYAGGKNTDAATQSVSWRILKNGTSVATGTQSGVTANYFWTHGYYQLYDVSVGDVLEIRLWSTSANVNYDYFALVIYPTRMNLGSSYLNKDVSYTNFTTQNLALGNPSANNTSSFLVYPSDNTSLNVGITANANFGAFHWNNTYLSGRADRGDSTITTETQISTTARPLYKRSYIPGTISFREILR